MRVDQPFLFSHKTVWFADERLSFLIIGLGCTLDE